MLPVTLRALPRALGIAPRPLLCSTPAASIRYVSSSRLCSSDRPDGLAAARNSLSAASTAPSRTLEQTKSADGFTGQDQFQLVNDKTEEVAKSEGVAGTSAAPTEGKKEEKVKAPKQPKPPPTPVRPLPSFIDLRVGKIVDVQRHPDADSLYVEKIDFGEAEPRTILSGLVKYVPMEAMQNRMIVGVTNLKPVNMRGIKSYGMVLCALSSNKAGVEPVFPPEGSVPGDKVWLEGYKNLPAEVQLNPKKKIFEAIQPGFLSTEEKLCAWRGVGPDEDPATAEPKIRVLQTDKGPVYTATFAGATLS